MLHSKSLTIDIAVEMLSNNYDGASGCHLLTRQAELVAVFRCRACSESSEPMRMT